MVEEQKDLTYIQRFNESWIFEMPRSTGPSGHNPFLDLKSAIESNLSLGYQEEKLGNNLSRLTIDPSEIYYWATVKDEMKIAARLSNFKKGLAIELVGKNTGSDIFASDFYQTILKTIPGSLLFGGNLLSDEGFAVWEKLLNTENTIMVYDPTNTKNFQKVNTAEQLKNFLGSTPDYEKYRYVLSNNTNIQEAVFSEFNLLRAYKLTFNIKD